MRVVIDTNVLISALLIGTSLPAQLIVFWREGRFALLTSVEQLDELRRVTRYPKIRERLSPALAGRLINELRGRAEMVSAVKVSPDPCDDYLLATAGTGHADFLVTGGKSGLLVLELYQSARIITVREFLDLHRRLS